MRGFENRVSGWDDHTVPCDLRAWTMTRRRPVNIIKCGGSTGRGVAGLLGAVLLIAGVPAALAMVASDAAGAARPGAIPAVIAAATPATIPAVIPAAVPAA